MCQLKLDANDYTFLDLKFCLRAMGMYFDGHEREDVVMERCEFLKKMVEPGFLHPDQAPTPEAAAAFPNDVPLA